MFFFLSISETLDDCKKRKNFTEIHLFSEMINKMRQLLSEWFLFIVLFCHFLSDFYICSETLIVMIERKE